MAITSMTVKIEASIKKALQLKALNEDTSLSALVRQAVEPLVNEKKRTA